MVRIPKVRLSRHSYRRPADDDLVTRAAAKNPRKTRKKETDDDYGWSAGSAPARPHHPEGWKSPPRQLKPKARVRTADNPNPQGFAPTGKHRGRGQAKDTGYTGRRRAYEGRHRPYEARHRSEGR